MDGAEDLLLAQVLPVHPGDVPGVAVVAVDVGVLPEERVGALRGREAAHAAQRRQVEPGVVLLARLDVAVAERADALQVERLEDGIETLLHAVAVGIRLLGLRIDVEPRRPEEAAEVVEEEVALDGHRAVLRDGAGVGVEVAQVGVVEPVHEPVLVVPHDLVGELRVLRVEVRERLPGDVVLQAEAVGRQLHLGGVLLGGLLVRLRPLDPLRLDDRDGEAALDAPLHARRDEVLHLGDVAGVDLVARRHVRERAPPSDATGREHHECQPDYSTHCQSPQNSRDTRNRSCHPTHRERVGPTPRRR